MKELPDPFQFVEIQDVIVLDEQVNALKLHLGCLAGDGRTKIIGDKITAVLIQKHMLSEGNDWDGQFEFLQEAVLELAKNASLNPVVLEAIRRGWCPYEKIPIRLIKSLDNFTSLGDLSNRLRRDRPVFL